MVKSECTTGDINDASGCIGVPPMNTATKQDYAQVVHEACRYVEFL